MQAIILAAGLGTRMQPLTNNIPKALVLLDNKPLIEHNIINLKNHGINNIVINLHYLGQQIKNYLQNGSNLGVKIQYSEEPVLLDTGGAINQIINNNLLKLEPFIVISTDIITNFNFSLLLPKLTRLAHLILVTNPTYKLEGDFSLDSNNNLINKTDNYINPSYTYSNIGIFKPEFFLKYKPLNNIFPLSYCLHQAIKDKQITGEVFNGLWHNIGTTKDLATTTI